MLSIRPAHRPILLAALIAGAIAPAAAQAAPEALTFDMHPAAGQTTPTPARSALTLPAGQTYVVTVRGTVSIWDDDRWSEPGSDCGAAETGPVNASPQSANGPVGIDADTLFALPPGGTTGFVCNAGAIPFHLGGTGTGFKIDSGSGFQHVEPVGGPFTAPRADHSYTYNVVSTGAPLSFTFTDGYYPDNYGVLGIGVQPVSSSAPAGQQVSSTTPGTTITGRTTGTASAQSVIVNQLPSATRCSSRRTVTIHVHAPKGVRFKTAQVLVLGKAQRQTLKSSLLTSTVNLKKLKLGRYTVSVRIVTTRGQVLRATRAYKTCTPKGR